MKLISMKFELLTSCKNLWSYNFLHFSQLVRSVWSLFLTNSPAFVRNMVYCHISSLCTLSGRTGSALIWQTRGRVFEFLCCSPSCNLQSAFTQCNICGTQGALPMRAVGATSQLDQPSDVIVHNWLWSTVTRSSPLGYFSILQQVVDNWPHILW